MKNQKVDQEDLLENTIQNENRSSSKHQQDLYVPFTISSDEKEELQDNLVSSADENETKGFDKKVCNEDENMSNFKERIGKSVHISVNSFDSSTNGIRASPGLQSQVLGSNNLGEINHDLSFNPIKSPESVVQSKKQSSRSLTSTILEREDIPIGNRITTIQDLKNVMKKGGTQNDAIPKEIKGFVPDQVQIDLSSVEIVRKKRRIFINEKNMGVISVGEEFDYIHGAGSILGRNPTICGRTDLKLFVHNNITEKESILHMIQMLTTASFDMTVPLLLYVLQSMQNRFFRLADFEPRHILWIKGASGSHKSNLASMFANVFNTHLENDIELSTFDTIPAILEYINGVSSMAVVIDDFIPSENFDEIQHQKKLGSQLRRTIGDRKAKKKLQRLQGESSFTITKSPHPDVGIICTAEDEPTGESDIARLTIVEFDKRFVDVEKAQHFRRTRTVYSTGIYHFMRFVLINGHQIVDFIEKESTQMRLKCKDMFVHDRFIDAYISMMITKEIYCKFLSGREIMSEDQVHSFSKMCEGVLWNLYTSNSYELIDQKPAVMFVKSIFSQLASGRVYLEKLNSRSEKKGKRIGFADDHFYYLIPDVAYQQCVQFYKSIGREYSATIRKTLKDLEKQKIIFTGMETRDGKEVTVRTLKMTLNDVKNFRFIVMKKHEVDNLL